MEAQEKSEWRKEFIGGGKHLGVSQSEAASVQRKQEEIFQGREGERRGGKERGGEGRGGKGQEVFRHEP